VKLFWPNTLKRVLKKTPPSLVTHLNSNLHFNSAWYGRCWWAKHLPLTLLQSPWTSQDQLEARDAIHYFNWGVTSKIHLLIYFSKHWCTSKVAYQQPSTLISLVWSHSRSKIPSLGEIIKRNSHSTWLTYPFGFTFIHYMNVVKVQLIEIMKVYLHFIKSKELIEHFRDFKSQFCLRQFHKL